MSDPDITVTLADAAFTLSELQAFIEIARGMAVEHEIGSGSTLYTMTASTAYRSKADA